MKRFAVLLVLVCVALTMRQDVAYADGGTKVVRFSGSRCDSVVFEGMVLSSCQSWRIHNVVTSGKTTIYVGRFDGNNETRMLSGELLGSSNWASDFHVVYDRDGDSYQIRQERIRSLYQTGSDAYDLNWKYIYTFANGEIRLQQRWIMGEKQY